MSEARIIKRYANRKLYDTQHSRYVTLDQIAEMIRGGDDVKIIDNKSKEDLTSVTLAQIIFEEEKRQKSFLPLQAMRNIIQSGGESITQLVSQAKGRVSQILPRKREDGQDPEGPEGAEGAEGSAGELLSADDSQGAPVVENPMPESAGSAGGSRPAFSAEMATEGDPGGNGVRGGEHGEEGAAAGRRAVEGLRNLREFREFLSHSQRAIDDWQRKVDGRIRHMFEGISPFATLQKDIGALSSRIAQLEAKLTQLVHDEPLVPPPPPAAED
jgi:polyhydroxyalkanoate synthesis repressor PhaR